MKKPIVYSLLVMASACTSYKSVEKERLSTSGSKKANETVLKQFDAEGNEHSLLIFTHDYNGEKITIKSGDKIIDESSVTTLNNGFGKAVRINNNEDVEIIDKLYKIKIKKKLSKTHKFIYVQKEEFLKNGVDMDSIVNGKKVKK
jgi:hypothetical protein